jgi:tetratricopeptide (TPR) repeat protein
MNRTIIILFLVFLFSLSACSGLLTRPEAKNQFEQGLTLFNQGRYRDAIPFFERAAEIDSDFSEAYLYIGRSYLNMGMWQNAIPPLRTAYNIAPEQMQKEIMNLLLDAFMGAALSEFKKGNFQNASSFLKEALIFDPYSTEAKNELAMTLIALGGQLFSEGKTTDAIASYTEAIDVSPDNPDAYLGLARALLRKGDLFKALNAVKQVITIDPANSEARSLFRMLQTP